MTPLAQATWWMLTLVGIAGTALCSATETGFYTLNRVRLNIRVAFRGSRSAAMLKSELEHPDGALSTLLIVNTLFGSLSATGISELLSAAGYSETLVVVLNVAILTPLLVILGEVVPKELGRVEADRFTYAAAPLLVGTRVLLTAIGVIPLVRLLSRAAARALGLEPGANLGSARERIAALLKEGVRHGVLSESQTSLLDRALALRHTTVGDEMVPWMRVRVVPERMDRSRLMDLMAQAPYSQLPVVDAAGRVIGILDTLDAALAPDKPVSALLRPPVFLAPDLPVRKALLALGRAGARLAVVQAMPAARSAAELAAPGPPAAGPERRPLGIVTAKDLIEPLTGELVAW